MATKTKSLSSITLTKPASKKLVTILRTPHTEAQREVIKRSTGRYDQYAARWQS